MEPLNWHGAVTGRSEGLCVPASGWSECERQEPSPQVSRHFQAPTVLFKRGQRTLSGLCDLKVQSGVA